MLATEREQNAWLQLYAAFLSTYDDSALGKHDMPVEVIGRSALLADSAYWNFIGRIGTDGSADAEPEECERAFNDAASARGMRAYEMDHELCDLREKLLKANEALRAHEDRARRS